MQAKIFLPVRIGEILLLQTLSSYIIQPEQIELLCIPPGG